MCKKVHHLYLLLLTWRKLTSIQVPSLLLLLPLKYSRPTLLPSIHHHKLGGKQQPKVGRNDSMKVLRRDKGKSTATQQLLAKKGHHGMPIPVHLSNAKALSLRTRNGDCCEVPDPKLKGTRAQERPDKSSRIQDSSEVIGYVLIKPKPPLHSVSKIMNIADALIDQIRQPPIIDGCQVCNPPLIKSSQ